MVDVFGGSGCVVFSFMTDKQKRYHYNDINPDMVGLIDTLTDLTKARALEEEASGVMKTADEVWSAIKGPYTRSRALSKFIALKHSWLGYEKAPNTRLTPGPVLGKFQPAAYARQFDGFTLEKSCKPYREILEQYCDDPTAFLYLDPPYISKEIGQYGYNFTIEDLMYIHDFMGRAKCKVMLNTDYVGFMRETFAEFHPYGYTFKFNPAGTMVKNVGVYPRYHIIFTNYAPPM
jgi:site-specific DNA-adenine methylase